MPSQYMGYIQDIEAVDIYFSSSQQELQHNREERGLEQKLHTFPISKKDIVHMTISTVNQKREAQPSKGVRSITITKVHNKVEI